MTNLEPITSKEHFLAALGGQNITPPEPVTLIETELNCILNGTPAPITEDMLDTLGRIEWYLAIISGVSLDPIEPVTRIEHYLAKIAGMDVEPPEPITRIEHFLADWVEQGGGSIGELVTVTGLTPLVLANALAGQIKSLTQTGKCAQSGTPTPEAPVDIVCNNGALRMVHRSGLPSGYKLLEYVGSSGAAYVVTDVFLASTDVVEAEFRNNSTTGYGAIYGVFRLGDSSALYANQTYYGYDESNGKVDTNLRVNTDWHSSRHDFVNGTLTIDDTTVTFTPFEFANTTQNAVLARYYNNSYGYIWKGFIRKFKVTRGGEVICDLLPAKNEQDEVGLYDLISGTFYTATGGTLVAGDEVNDYEPAVVGTPEVLTVGTQTATVPDLYAVGDYKDEQDIITGAITRRVGVKVLTGEEPFSLYQSSCWAANVFDDHPKVSGNALSICSHYAWTTASVSGMADGTFQLNGTARLCIKDSRFETAAKFRAEIAAQYAAGTPVILIYPLAEEQTEQAAGQSLRTSEGSNTISVTSEVGEVELEVTYRRASA